MCDFPQLGVLLPSRAASNREDALQVGIDQAFAQNALAHHAGCTEENHVHMRSCPELRWVQSIYPKPIVTHGAPSDASDQHRSTRKPTHVAAKPKTGLAACGLRGFASKGVSRQSDFSVS